MKNTKNTNKNLTWKLSELPSAGEIASLVDSGVITKEEARDIMFGNPESDKEKIEALEKLVDFLQGLIKDLTKNKQTFIPYERTVYIDRHIRPYWDRYWGSTERVLCNSGLAVSGRTTGSLTTTGSSVGFTTTAVPAVLYNGAGVSQDAVTLCVATGNTIS